MQRVGGGHTCRSLLFSYAEKIAIPNFPNFLSTQKFSCYVVKFCTGFSNVNLRALEHIYHDLDWTRFLERLRGRPSARPLSLSRSVTPPAARAPARPAGAVDAVGSAMQCSAVQNRIEHGLAFLLPSFCISPFFLPGPVESATTSEYARFPSKLRSIETLM